MTRADPVKRCPEVLDRLLDTCCSAIVRTTTRPASGSSTARSPGRVTTHRSVLTGGRRCSMSPTRWAWYPRGSSGTWPVRYPQPRLPADPQRGRLTSAPGSGTTGFLSGRTSPTRAGRSLSLTSARSRAHRMGRSRSSLATGGLCRVPPCELWRGTQRWKEPGSDTNVPPRLLLQRDRHPLLHRPRPTLLGVRDEAVRILRAGDPVGSLMGAFALDHVGDETVAACLIMSLASQRRSSIPMDCTSP